MAGKRQKSKTASIDDTRSNELDASFAISSCRNAWMMQQDAVSQYLSDLQLAIMHDICKLLNASHHPAEDLQSTHSTLTTHMMSTDVK